MEKAMGLSNVQKKIDNFSQFLFFSLKNGNEINRQEQNTSLNPKKRISWTLCMEKISKQ